jgi:hypothetical protein
MELDDVQKDKVRAWVEEGCGLSEIQERLSAELGITMTYMEVRLLTLDLGAAVRDKAVDTSPATDLSGVPDRGAPDVAAGGAPGADRSSGGGGVTVDVDRVMKPESIVSGTVTFSDGVSASWMLDQLGRLAIDARQPGYRPSEQDLLDFQEQLKQVLQRRGF